MRYTRAKPGDGGEVAGAVRRAKAMAEVLGMYIDPGRGDSPSSGLQAEGARHRS